MGSTSKTVLSPVRSEWLPSLTTRFLLPALSTTAVKATRGKTEIAHALHGNIQQTLGVRASASGLRERTDLYYMTWVSVQV